MSAKKAFRRDESGASAVEYALLIAGIAAIIILVIFAFGGYINKLMGDTCGTIQATVSGGTSCGP